jgi:hypothetical protein
MGFSRHGQEGLNIELEVGGDSYKSVLSPLGIIQCHLHPVIPR